MGKKLLKRYILVLVTYYLLNWFQQRDIPTNESVDTVVNREEAVGNLSNIIFHSLTGILKFCRTN